VRFFYFLATVIGLIVNIITLASFFGSGAFSAPVKAPPIDVDFAYMLLLSGGTLYAVGFIGIKEKMTDAYLDEGWMQFLAVLYFIPLIIIIYLALRMFGYPKATFLRILFGPFVDLFKPR
jgi:hypothetical protein